MRRRLSDIGLALILLALAFCPGKAYPQVMVQMPESGYGMAVYASLPRDAVMALILPHGDTIWIGNAVDTLNLPGMVYLPDCAERRSSVIVSRLVVAVNQRRVAEFPMRERGSGKLTDNFRVATPSGDTLIVREVYRRKTTCGMGDGSLIVWFVITRPPAGPRS